jgi:HAD-superfamily hydrolase, subfamily IIB
LISVKMIVSDLDKTLLNDDGIITDFTASVLQKCRERGILVVFATARSEKASARFVEKFTPDAIISNGGALAKLGDDEIYKKQLSPQTANEIIRSLSADSGTGYITAETDSGYFVNYPIDESNLGWRDYFYAQYRDFTKDPLECGVYKLTVETANPMAIYALRGCFADVSVIQFAGEMWCRYAHNLASKWTALEALAHHLAIDAKEIVSFGDDFIDMEMLGKCGIGVAPENAADEVKEIADFVCDTNNNDGVAVWLEHHCL